MVAAAAVVVAAAAVVVAVAVAVAVGDGDAEDGGYRHSEPLPRGPKEALSLVLPYLW